MDNSTIQDVPTGLALEKARRRIGLRAMDAAARLGISPGVLGDFESGLRTPNDEIVAAMSALYGVEPDQFASRPLAPRTPPRYDSDAGVLWLGNNAIALRDGDHEHVVRWLAAALRSMRSLPASSPVIPRTPDLELLSSILDLDDPELENVLMQHLNVSPSDALGLINEMVVYATVS